MMDSMMAGPWIAPPTEASPTVDRAQETLCRDSLPAARGVLLSEGSRFGRYTILGELGRGAMATVYTAFDEQLDRKIAIKLIRDPETRVRREAQAVARVSHPNVVQVYEIGTFEGHDFIAMELVDGINLGAWQRLRSRNVYDIIAKYAEAGRGLAAAHRAGLVHRDFKPENVLVDNNGRARVGDFGLACTHDSAVRVDLATTLSSWAEGATRDDDLVGTPAYMAPEQFLSPDVDERADQFSLCASLYEAVYGVRPFAGANLEELRRNALAGALQEPPREATAPPTLRALLRRGLATDPAERWPSLVDLLDRLDRLDAQRDPAAAAAERRRLVVAVMAVAFSVLTVQLMMGAEDSANITLREQVGMPAAVLAVTVVAVYLGRVKLLSNNFHRQMIALLVSILASFIVVGLICARAGFAVDDALFIEQLGIGQLYLFAAPFIAPVLLVNCLIPWVAATAIACGAPAVQCSTLSSMVSLVFYVWTWSRGPAARNVLSLNLEVATSRHIY